MVIVMGFMDILNKKPVLRVYEKERAKKKVHITISWIPDIKDIG